MAQDNDLVIYIDEDTFSLTVDDDGIVVVVEAVGINETAAAQAAEDAAAGFASNASASAAAASATAAALATALATLGANSGALNVKSAPYLAFGDFSHDDTAAAIALINDSYAQSTQPTGGTDRGTIAYFPNGTFKVRGPLPTNGYISIRGAGKKATAIVNMLPNTDLWQVGPSTEFSDIGLFGSARMPTPVMPTAGWAITSTNALPMANGCRISNCEIGDFYNGVNFQQGSNCLVNFLYLYNLYGDFGLQDVEYITDNQLDMTFFGGQPDYTSGFKAWTQSETVALLDVRFANGCWFICTQAGTTSNAGTGPVRSLFATTIVDGSAHWTFQSRTDLAMVNFTAGWGGGTVKGNDIAGPISYGIQSASPGQMISGNNFAQTQGLAIRLLTGADDPIISGNQFTECFGSSAVGGSAIAGDTLSGAIISENAFNGSSLASIKFFNSLGMIISKNRGRGPYGSPSADFWAALTSCGSFNVQDNNIFASAGAGAVDVVTPTNTNYFVDHNNFGGMGVTHPAGGTVTDNY